MNKNKRRSAFLFYFTLSFLALILLLCAVLLFVPYYLTNKGYLPVDRPFTSFPFLILISVSSLIGICFTITITRIFYRPVRKMSQNFKEVAKGNFNIKIEDDTLFEEINEMYKNFNTMTNELSNIETLRNDFIVSVSHEIKTPLAAIEGYATLLQNENLDIETQNLYKEKIIQNTRSLSDLTGNILTLSKLEHQDLVTDKVTFSLDEQIKNVIINLEPAWSKKNIEFDLNLNETSYSTNKGLSYQIWYNLINNAIKYNKEDGKIAISIKKDIEFVIVTISDTGIGISKEKQKYIFDKFYQADTSHKSEGNGLGLALVKRIVELMNAKIEVESNLNEGSTFIVYLPLN